MKDLLIIANDMEIGGAERVLLGLLQYIDTTEYHVDLFLLKHTGPFMKMIPEKINLLNENSKYADLAVPIMNVLKKGHLDMVWGRFVGKYAAERYRKRNGISGITSVGIQYSYKYTKKYLPVISRKQYDLVISFTTPFYIPIEKTTAKKKVAWIHTDYEKITGDRKEERRNWEQYDELIAVSENVKTSFLKAYPGFNRKITVIENIISDDLIMKQADEYAIDIIDSGIKLLSMGRFTYAKNFESIPQICSIIREKGIDCNWYIIGYGNDETIIRNVIEKYNMENHVIILGKKDNPYPYIKWCDCYIQPSRFEGKSVAVREAQILNKPVIITNYPTSASQLEDKVDGFIVPLETEKCAESIVELLENKELLEGIVKNYKNRDYTNKDEIKKVYDLFK